MFFPPFVPFSFQWRVPDYLCAYSQLIKKFLSVFFCFAKCFFFRNWHHRALQAKRAWVGERNKWIHQSGRTTVAAGSISALPSQQMLIE